MDKKILIAICLVLLIVIIVFLYLIFGTNTFKQAKCPNIAQTCPDGSIVYPEGPNCEYPQCTFPEGYKSGADLETACTGSGGTVETSTCCQSSSDFPNTCLIGACGCSPNNSKETKTCTCPEGSCFDGTSCTAPITE